ncbi:MAG: hypothetical protein J7500_06905 [Sphingomonas sp.]|uniref:hypothetical protein n=1 Tax=Sphingomonas sp. TaxID=28214 RepID=UPI001AFEAAE2|nr:hypothetical protein [Sphingomonas sp.]MBO9622423.1 hypothetical protein [Sphingomonas sp.]
MNEAREKELETAAASAQVAPPRTDQGPEDKPPVRAYSFDGWGLVPLDLADA